MDDMNDMKSRFEYKYETPLPLSPTCFPHHRHKHQDPIQNFSFQLVQSTHSSTPAANMKFSIAAILALAAAVIAAPTPGGYDGDDCDSCDDGGYDGNDGYDGDYGHDGYRDGHGGSGYGGQFNHVYCTDNRNTILDVNIDIQLSNRIRQCSRNENWGSGIGYGVRNDSDDFCRKNDRVGGVWGCSEPCDVSEAPPNLERNVGNKTNILLRAKSTRITARVATAAAGNTALSGYMYLSRCYNSRRLFSMQRYRDIVLRTGSVAKRS